MPRYITLPSDSSPEYYPQNTTARYRVHLPEPITFDHAHKYEVALAQLQ